MAAPHSTSIALGFAFEDWPGDPPQPRSLDDLRNDSHFMVEAADAVVAAIAPAGMAEAA